jgi:hypothetical protein
VTGGTGEKPGEPPPSGPAGPSGIAGSSQGEAVDPETTSRQAIPEYVGNHSRAQLLDRVLDEELPRYAEALITGAGASP